MAGRWRSARGDGPPAPDELLLIVLRSKRSPNTRRLYARELVLFVGFSSFARTSRPTL